MSVGGVDLCDRIPCPCEPRHDRSLKGGLPFDSYMIQNLPSWKADQPSQYRPPFCYPANPEERCRFVTGLYTNPGQPLLSPDCPRYTVPDRHRNTVNQVRDARHGIILSMHIRQKIHDMEQLHNMDGEERNTNQYLDDSVCETIHGKNKSLVMVEKVLDCKSRAEEVHNALTRALVEQDRAAGLTQQNMMKRRERKGIDNVYDSVEEGLEREMCIYQEVARELCALSQRAIQLVNQAADVRRALESEIDQKCWTVQVDTVARNTNKDSHLEHCWGIERIPHPTTRTEEERHQLAVKNMYDAEKVRHKTTWLSRDCTTALRRTSDALRDAWDITNQALKENIEYTKTSLEGLMASLHVVNVEILNVQRDSEAFKTIIDDETQLKQVHTRLRHRNARPCMERNLDRAHYSLVQLAYDMPYVNREKRINQLHMTEMFDKLPQIRHNLEHDIQVKRFTLHIDREVLDKRKLFPSVVWEIP